MSIPNSQQRYVLFGRVCVIDDTKGGDIPLLIALSWLLDISRLNLAVPQK